MTIYKKVLGIEFYKLHPKLQRRYEFHEGRPFHAKGMMNEISGGHSWMYPMLLMGTCFNLLFPERGQNIPFTVVNTPQIGKDGEEEIRWERTFFFKKKKRHFHAVMSLDSKRMMIKDYLGEPSPLYSDLVLHVTSEGGLLIESKKQRLVVGRLEIPLPKLLQGLATVTETYNDKRNCYVICVQVKNPLLGTVFSYKGEFTKDDV